MCSAQSHPSSQVLVQQYLDFLRLERRYSDNSIAAVRRDLSLVADPLLNVSSAVLKTILAKRHAAGAAPASLARLASSWRGFYGFLVVHEHLETDPTLGLKTPRLTRSLPKAVGVDSLAALLHGSLPQTYRFAQAHVLIELLYCTGLRISEALSLRSVVLNNATELRVTGKGNKSRIVPVIDSLKERLRDFSQLRAAHLSTVGNPSEDALFVSVKGGALSVRQAQQHVSDYARHKGFEQHLHPHMLRHSFGSHVLQGTQNLRAVQELLGHSSIASTQVYTALDFDHLTSVYDKAFPRAK